VNDFHFLPIDGTSSSKTLLDFLAKQDLGYPRYEEWVAKAEAELRAGYKRAVVCLSGNKVVADIVWQAHKELPRIREIKNLRVAPEVRGRYVAMFLLKQAEVEDSGNCEALLCDVRARQSDTIQMLLTAGWQPFGTKALYEEGVDDVLMMKTKQERRGGLLLSARSVYGL
jgi:hypothetical protein